MVNRYCPFHDSHDGQNGILEGQKIYVCNVTVSCVRIVSCEIKYYSIADSLCVMIKSVVSGNSIEERMRNEVAKNNSGHGSRIKERISAGQCDQNKYSRRASKRDTLFSSYSSNNQFNRCRVFHRCVIVKLRKLINVQDASSFVCNV